MDETTLRGAGPDTVRRAIRSAHPLPGTAGFAGAVDGCLVETVPDVVTATGRTDAMAVQIALPLLLTARRVRKDGHDHLALGQGADELFGGYDKVAAAPRDSRVEANTVAGARREVLRSLPSDLERDWLTLRFTGVTPVMPYLQDAVVRAGLRLSSEALVSTAGERKSALRGRRLHSLLVVLQSLDCPGQCTDSDRAEQNPSRPNGTPTTAVVGVFQVSGVRVAVGSGVGGGRVTFTSPARTIAPRRPALRCDS